MDFEKKMRRQSLRVIISEACMVLTVIVTVVVLAFLVSGYWLNSDFEVKRQGLLQISSTPSGADVEIDGESSWLQRTNLSKVLTSGKHTIKLTKEGYDSWEKTVDIREGLLYRLRYPRLFLKERFTEDITSVTGTTFATISSDKMSLILANGTSEWLFINLEDEKIEPRKLDVKDLFSSISLAEGATTGLFTGEILEAKWSPNGNKVLFKVNLGDKIEWAILAPKDPKHNINLTSEFGVDFSNVEIFDNDANSLLAVQNHNLHKIDVSGRAVSTVLVSDVDDFDFYNNELIFSASEDTEAGEKYYVGLLKIGDDKIEKFKTVNTPAKVATMRFYEDRYFLILDQNHLEVYQNDMREPVESYELKFEPTMLKVGYEGKFILAPRGSEIATLDMEAMELCEWTVEGEKFGWIDDNMIYTVHDGELIVYDFDGLNRRSLAKNVSNFYPISITNNRYLYYFSDNLLVREWLIPR